MCHSYIVSNPAQATPMEHLCKRAGWEKCFLCFLLFLGYHVPGAESALSKLLSWSPMMGTDLSTLRNLSIGLGNQCGLVVPPIHSFHHRRCWLKLWCQSNTLQSSFNYGMHVGFHAMETPPMAFKMFHFLCLEPGPFLSTFHIKKKSTTWFQYARFIQYDAPAQWLHATAVFGSWYKRWKCFMIVPLSLWAAHWSISWSTFLFQQAIFCWKMIRYFLNNLPVTHAFLDDL